MNNRATFFLYALVINLCLIFSSSYSMDFSRLSLDEHEEKEDILGGNSMIISSSQSEIVPTLYSAPQAAVLDQPIMQIPAYFDFYNAIDDFTKTKITEASAATTALNLAKTYAKDIERLESGSDPNINRLETAVHPLDNIINSAKKRINQIYFKHYPGDLPQAIIWFMNKFQREDEASKQNALLILDLAKKKDSNFGHKSTIDSVIHNINNPNKSVYDIHRYAETIANYFKPNKPISTPTKTLLSKENKESYAFSSNILTRWEPLTKDSFLAFYQAINQYLITHNRKDLEKAQEYLVKNFDASLVAAITVYRDFLDKKSAVTVDEINAVKNALNNYYFLRNRDDLCKSVPFFLEAIIANNNDDTKGDATRILDRLYISTEDSNAKVKIDEAKIFIQNIKDEASMATCLNMLDDICHFFPNKDFKKASERLQEYGFTRLLSLSKYDSAKKEAIINEINTDISTMINFIKPKSSYAQKRLTILSKIQGEITVKSTYTPEKIKKWIEDIQDITEETLKPSIEGSSLGLTKKQENREAEKKAQKEAEEKLQQQKSEITKLILTDSSALLTYPVEMIKFIKDQERWSLETKISFLQLLFWYAWKNKDEAQKEFMRALIKEKGSVKSILTEMAEKNSNILGMQWDENKQLIAETTKVFTEKGSASLARITHNEDGVALPYFTFTFETLPADTPNSLETLFNEYKQTKDISIANQPILAIKRLHKGIQTLKGLLTEIENETFKEILPSEEIAELESKEENIFYTQKQLLERISKLTPEDQEEALTRFTTDYQKELLSHLSSEQQEGRRKKYLTEREKYQKERLDLIQQLSAEPERTKRKIIKYIKEKQQKIEVLIGLEVEKIETILLGNQKETTNLDTTEKKLKKFQQYTSKKNELLQKQILRALYLILKNRADNDAKLNAINQRIVAITNEIQILKRELPKNKEQSLEKPSESTQLVVPAIKAELPAVTPTEITVVSMPEDTLPEPIATSVQSAEKTPQELILQARAITYASDLRSMVNTWQKNPSLIQISPEALKNYNNMLSDCVGYQTITEEEANNIQEIIGRMFFKYYAQSLASITKQDVISNDDINQMIFYIIHIANNIQKIDQNDISMIGEQIEKLTTLAPRINEQAEANAHGMPDTLAKNSVIIQQRIPSFPMLGKKIAMPILRVTVSSITPNQPVAQPNLALQTPVVKGQTFPLVHVGTPQSPTPLVPKIETPATPVAPQQSMPQLPKQQQSGPKPAPSKGFFSNVWQSITSGLNSLWSTMRGWLLFRAGG